MATYTMPFRLGKRVTIGANTVGAPVDTVGVVVDLQNIGASGAWVARVRVPDDVWGNADFMVPVAALTAA